MLSQNLRNLQFFCIEREVNQRNVAVRAQTTATVTPGIDRAAPRSKKNVDRRSIYCSSSLPTGRCAPLNAHRRQQSYQSRESETKRKGMLLIKYNVCASKLILFTANESGQLIKRLLSVEPAMRPTAKERFDARHKLHSVATYSVRSNTIFLKTKELRSLLGAHDLKEERIENLRVIVRVRFTAYSMNSYESARDLGMNISTTAVKNECERLGDELKDISN
ncbi:hypothetical protein ACFE04_002751 [Oxalis oulophora]